MNIGNNVRDSVILAEEGDAPPVAPAGGDVPAGGDAPAGGDDPVGANDEDEDEDEDEFHEAQEGRPIQYWNGEGPCPTCGFA